MKKYKVLKKIRVVISLIFLVVLGLFFLDFAGTFPSEFISGVIFLQFVPSLLKFFTVFSWVATGFIAITILTLLFGRVYCSTICPLGIMQDVVSWLRRRFEKKKKKYRYLKAMRWLRYGILGATVAFLASGSIVVLSIFDPYSTFGRIVSDLFRPVLTEGNNLLAGVLNKFDIYALYHVDLHSLHAGVLAVPMAFLIAVVWMSLAQGRIYCNTICPVGTFLGLLSKVSLYQIRLNPTTCTKCGICEKKCKASCIDTKNMKLDFARCVGCFNCLQACPFSAAEYSINPLYRSLTLNNGSGGKTNNESSSKQTSYKNSSQKRQSQDSSKKPQTGASSENPAHSTSAASENKQGSQSHHTDTGKRKFLAGIALAFFSATKLSKAQELVSYSATKPVKRDHPVSPPGAESTDRFNEKCTACHLCVNACPTQVLQPALLEYGLRGLMQPRMDYHAGFCNYDCVECGDVCPTGAILPIKLEDKKRVQLGKAQFVKENCIVETEGTDCGSCSEHCPTKAVQMVDYKNNLRIPEVNDEICVGCGACEYACPTHPYKAIYVEGNPVHLQAKKPQQEKVKREEPKEDFPF